MLHKTTKMTVSNKRSVTKFFQRMIENFERKFDGFPAANESAQQTPAVQEGLVVINPDDIGRLIGDQWQVNTDPCASGSLTETLTFVGEDGWQSAYPAKYFTWVSRDGLRLIQDIDFVVEEGLVLIPGSLSDDEVVAEYVPVTV